MHRLYEEKIEEMEKKTIKVNGEIWEEVAARTSDIDKGYLVYDCVMYQPQKKELTLDEIYTTSKYYGAYGDGKLHCIVLMLAVADYLNEGSNYRLCYIDIGTTRDAEVQNCSTNWLESFCYFKSREAAERAIKILGEETIKLALS